MCSIIWQCFNLNEYKCTLLVYKLKNAIWYIQRPIHDHDLVNYFWMNFFYIAGFWHTCCNSSSIWPARMTIGPLTAYSIPLTWGFIFSTVSTFVLLCWVWHSLHDFRILLHPLDAADRWRTLELILKLQIYGQS